MGSALTYSPNAVVMGVLSSNLDKLQKVRVMSDFPMNHSFGPIIIGGGGGGALICLQCS